MDFYISVESFEILVELGLKKIEKFSLDLKKASDSDSLIFFSFPPVISEPQWIFEFKALRYLHNNLNKLFCI